MTENKVVNEFDKRPTYNFGRLMAVCQHIQELAAPNLNRTLTDSYFRFACQNPAFVLKRIVTLGMIRYRQLKKIPGKKDIYELFNRLIASIDGFLPERCDTSEEVAFVLGYFQQRACLAQVDFDKRAIPTKNGQYLVCSHGEKIISDALYDLGIKHKYEKALTVPNVEKESGKSNIFPDFTIQNIAGTRILFIEYCGMAGDRQYDINWSKKRRRYRDFGAIEYSRIKNGEEIPAFIYCKITELTRDRDQLKSTLRELVDTVIGEEAFEDQTASF